MNEIQIVQEQATNELSISNSSLVHIAEQVEKRVEAINTIMKASLKMTNYLDWVKMGESVYLQETGASKIARLMGVSWQIGQPIKTYDIDGSGHYTYQYNGTFSFAGAEIDAYGMRTTKDEFFIGSASKGNQKKPQDVDERDVMQAAYTNCINNGIKRIIPGLRNVTLEILKESGIDTEKIKGFGFNTGNKTEMTEESKNQKSEIERMLKEVYGEKWKQGLEKITEFTGKDGNLVAGKTDVAKLSEKQAQVTYGKVKTNYEMWVKENGQQTNNGKDSGNETSEN